MAVATTNAFSGPFTANGSTTIFPFTFTVLSGADVTVALRDADGVETPVSANDYAVTLTGDAPSAGAVTFDVAPATGNTVWLYLDPAFTQETEFVDGHPFIAGAVNNANDRAALRDQVLRRDVDRALLVPIGESGPQISSLAGQDGKVLGLVDGKIVPVANDVVEAADYAAAAQNSADDAANQVDAATAAAAAAEAAQAAAELAETGAVAAALTATDYYPGARSYVPRGMTSVALTAAGSGGTNGTYTCPLTGDNLTVDAYATVTVAGGAVTAVTVAAPGLYIGASPTAGTVDTASITGLTGATLTPTIGYLKTSGQYYLTDHASDAGQVSLFQNQADAAVEVDASVDWLNIGLSQAWAEGTLPGGAGTKSAKEWSEVAEAEADAAAASAALAASARKTITSVSPSSGVVTINVALGDYFNVTVSEAITGWQFENVEAAKGERIAITLLNRGFAVAWPDNFLWADGVVPEVGAAYTSDTITLLSVDGGLSWRASFDANTEVGGDAKLVAALALNPVWLYDHKDPTIFYTDTAMTTQAYEGDVVRARRDKSGNGNHCTSPSDAQAGILRKIGDLYYIESDGSNDYMVTGAIDLTGTDAVTLCMGFRKLTDATLGVFFESSSSTANNGTFAIHAPPSNGTTQTRVISRGTVSADTAVVTTAPVTSVTTLLADVSSDVLIMRQNGAQVASTTGDQGTGNYGNTPHYFWMRGGATLPAKVYDFGGALYPSQLSGTDLAAVEAFVTDRTANVVSYPSGFAWSGGPTIITNGEEYTTTFDIDAMRPTTSVTYYIDPVAGSDANDGLSTGAPRAKLSTTVTLANAGGVAAKFLCKPGVYRGDVGWYGAAPTVNVILEPWADDPTDLANRIWFILPALPDSWVYDNPPLNTSNRGDGYRCTGSYASDPWAIFDQKVMDERGFPMQYEKAANYAGYLANVGTWWRDSATSRLYIHPFDKRDLRALFLAGQPHQIEICTNGGGNNLRFDATTNLDLWMQNVCLIDGSNVVWIKDASAGLTINVYLKDVLAVGGVLGDGMDFHALNAGSTTNAYLKRCGTGYNLSDGFDYRADPAVPTAAAFGFEDECFTARNGYDASGANNASTAHGQSTVITLNCDYDGSQNRVVNDIESSKRWMIDTTVRASLSTDATGVTVQAGSASGSHTAQIWLQDCDIAESDAAAVYAISGCAVRYKNTSLAGLTLDGAGDIVPY